MRAPLITLSRGLSAAAGAEQATYPCSLGCTEAVTQIVEDGTPYDDRERIHMVARLIRWYRHRWGIENGYKKIKIFMARTTSTWPRYRFFNFMFTCVLYNTWRLVDLLVKLSLEEDADYSPRVDANQFVTIAKQYYGLDPPD